MTPFSAGRQLTSGYKQSSLISIMETESATSQTPKGPAEKAWADAYEHLQKGYDNGQQVIRAMDTKTSILTGLSIFAFGAIAGLIKIFTDYFTKYPEDIKALFNPHLLSLVLLIIFAGTVVAAAVLGIRCILSCLGTLIARPRSKMPDSPQTTILFPFLHPESMVNERQKDIEYYRRINGGEVDRNLIQNEYYDQILNLGHILWHKITHNGQAVHWFRWQVGLTGTALILTIPALLAVSYVRNNDMPQQEVPIANQPANVPLTAAISEAPTTPDLSGTVDPVAGSTQMPAQYPATSSDQSTRSPAARPESAPPASYPAAP